MKNTLTKAEIEGMREVSVITDTINTFKTVLFEPMDDRIYAVFENLDEAKATYNISERYDWFGVYNNTLYVGLAD